MKRLLFIYNPTSGKGKVASSLSNILNRFAKLGWLTTVYPTQCHGDAVKAAQELGPQFDRVVCAGGDGTLSETVSGLMGLESPPTLGYIPVGSTNDCATTFSLPLDPTKAAQVAVQDGIPRPSDIGTLNDQSFVYVAAFGAFTKVAYDTPQELKNTFGHLAYVMEGIASLPSISPYHLRVEHDGEVIEDNFYFGMVSNALSIGGIKAPKREHVVLDDGLFEVNLVKKPVSLLDVADGFQSFMAPGMVSGGALVHFQSSHITFTCDRPLPWTIDGEYGGEAAENQVHCCQQALSIVHGV